MFYVDRIGLFNRFCVCFSRALFGFITVCDFLFSPLKINPVFPCVPGCTVGVRQPTQTECIVQEYTMLYGFCHCGDKLLQTTGPWF